mmetsp:Transcript_22960/g.53607  ORF Transcript_22960/g.53607 Transcript_22960/m.53607 type:complete len:230 (+) Transcript_22960:174-863(+)
MESLGSRFHTSPLVSGSDDITSDSKSSCSALGGQWCVMYRLGGSSSGVERYRVATMVFPTAATKLREDAVSVHMISPPAEASDRSVAFIAISISCSENSVRFGKPGRWEQKTAPANSESVWPLIIAAISFGNFGARTAFFSWNEEIPPLCCQRTTPPKLKGWALWTDTVPRLAARTCPMIISDSVPLDMSLKNSGSTSSGPVAKAFGDLNTTGVRPSKIPTPHPSALLP